MLARCSPKVALQKFVFLLDYVVEVSDYLMQNVHNEGQEYPFRATLILKEALSK